MTAASVTGCGGGGSRSANLTSRSPQPRIHSIGSSNILVYEDGRPLTIPITGAFFADESLIWSITLAGVSPLTEGVDYVISHPDGFAQGGDPNQTLGIDRSNVIAITLSKEYIDLVETGDTLDVEVSVADGTEHLVLERLDANQTKIDQLLAELTAELNQPCSDEQVINRTVSELLVSLHESSDFIAKLRVADAVQERVLFDADVGAVRRFLSRRIDIPVNLRDEVRSPTEEGGGNRRRGGPTTGTQEIQTWSGLERRLQSMDERQRSLVSQRKSRPIRSPLLSTAARRFVLYNASNYRQEVLGSTIPVHDLSAYPLPADETERLFGPEVTELYFVVRLSVRNTSARDRLISTGMIKAYGRAVVGGVEGAEDEEVPVFTVPVEIVPQSREHVYTVVADGKKHTPRDIVFRSLTFAGTLATALTTAFGAPIDAIRGVAVFTGVGIPAGSKLWPDEVPGYLSNIVNYSMADLVKVPKNSVVGHRYLFFSKGDLQVVISDTARAQQLIDAARGDGPRVVYMAFESLQIPYENVRRPGETSEEELLRKQAEAAQQQVLELERRAIEEARDTAIAQAETKGSTVGRLETELADAEDERQQLAVEIASMRAKLEATQTQMTQAVQAAVNQQQLDQQRQASELELARERQQREAADQQRRATLTSGLDAAIANLDAVASEVRAIIDGWGPGDPVATIGSWNLVFEDWQRKREAAAAVLDLDLYPASGLPEFERYRRAVRQTLRQWQYVLEQFAPERLRAKLYSDPRTGLFTLEEQMRQLRALAAQVETGADVDVTRPIADADAMTARARRLLDLYQLVGRDIDRLPLYELLPDLVDADTGDLRGELERLQQPLLLYDRARAGTDAMEALRPPRLPDPR